MSEMLFLINEITSIFQIPKDIKNIILDKMLVTVQLTPFKKYCAVDEISLKGVSFHVVDKKNVKCTTHLSITEENPFSEKIEMLCFSNIIRCDLGRKSVQIFSDVHNTNICSLFKRRIIYDITSKGKIYLGDYTYDNLIVAPLNKCRCFLCR